MKRYDNERSQDPKRKSYNQTYAQTYGPAYRQRPGVKERQREREFERYHSDTEYREERKAKTRGRTKRLGGKHLKHRTWPALLERDGPYCGICGGNLDPTSENFHVDHIQPVSKGGKNNLSNLQLAHPACNIKKKDKWDGTAPADPPAQLPLFA